MNLLRSITRRGYTVGTAGWFTVTTPNRWFSASHLPGGVHDLLGQSKKPRPAVSPAPPSTTVLETPSAQNAPEHVANQEITLPLQVTIPGAIDRGLIRFILIVLAAAALTLGALWWLSARHPWAYVPYR